MKAIVRTKYGSPDVLELREIDKPIPKDNQVLIKVKAASVNPFDWHVLRGEPFLIRLMGYGISTPKHQVIGADIAGQIEAVGKDVTQFKVGDEVFGSGLGSFAEFACINESTITHKPSNLTFEQAAAVPIAGLTALQALKDHGQLKDGQDVLINGASGGVGSFAVQIAKAMGAQVTGVCSSKNVEMVQSLGADHVIDYTKEDYWLNKKQYDLIVDNAAFYSLSKPMQALKDTGIYVGVGGSSSTLSALKAMIFNPIIAKMRGRQVVSFIAKMNQSELILINEFLESAKVVPFIDRKYSLSETPDAIKYIEEGHTLGKVVITI